ncbi:MAG: hypothetical protein B7Z58_18165 [Acidiphilium sp. 37-64-53]|nr:MAG: hypothetical protein B7Z58_18165 [Acidiphilium sp. 37-64-53]
MGKSKVIMVAVGGAVASSWHPLATRCSSLVAVVVPVTSAMAAPDSPALLVNQMVVTMVARQVAADMRVLDPSTLLSLGEAAEDCEEMAQLPPIMATILAVRAENHF